MMGADIRAEFQRQRFACRVLVLALLAITMSALPVAAQDQDEPQEASWMPSIAIAVGVLNQQISGDTSADSGDFPREGGDSLISEFFDFEFKVHTPLMLDIPTKPRIFLMGGVQIPLAESLIAERIDRAEIDRYPRTGPPPSGTLNTPDDSAFVTSDFSQFCADTLPLLGGGQPISPAPSNNVFGRGTSCSLRIRNLISIEATWHAGFGVELVLPVAENQFRIRPSLEYFGMAIQSEGLFNRLNSGTSLDDFEEFASTTGDIELMHGLSPSLAFSVDVYEDGPWRWSMYLQGRAVHFFKDPDLESRAAVGADNILFVGGVDRWMFQASGGLQIQWTGKRRSR